jgi:hypothetical protein
MSDPTSMLVSMHVRVSTVSRLKTKFSRVLPLAVLGAAACAHQAPTPAIRAPSSMQLFLLVGQSNMAGRGVVETQDSVVHPRVLMFDRERRWRVAVDPMHFDKPIAGVGPGRSFGIALAAMDSDVRIGLIPAAVGGSPIPSWAPGAADVATHTHPYDDAIARARAAMHDGTLKAVLWHQGESDSDSAASLLYAQRLRAVISRFREDLGDPSMPFIIGQLGRFDDTVWTSGRARVDSAHRALAAEIPNVAFVSSEGLRDKSDKIHFTAAAARELGRRYAAAYRRMSR